MYVNVSINEHSYRAVGSSSLFAIDGHVIASVLIAQNSVPSNLTNTYNDYKYGFGKVTNNIYLSILKFN